MSVCKQQKDVEKCKFLKCHHGSKTEILSIDFLI